MNLKQLYVATCKKVMVAIGNRLPKRMKRTVLLASLSASLKGTTKFDDETMNKLNSVMSLASRTKDLETPVYLSKAIWHGQGTKEILGTSQPVEALSKNPSAGMIESFLSKVPEWLRYGTDDEIKGDLINLLKYQDTIFGH